MKTFKDLEFVPHKIAEELLEARANGHEISDLMSDMLSATQARITFDNGYSLSIISGNIFYCNENTPYEIAIMDKDGSLMKDPIGYCTEEDVTSIMCKVQERK